MFFERKMVVRIKEGEYQMMMMMMQNLNPCYYSISHFIRCAIIEKMRKEDNETNKNKGKNL